MSNRRSSRTTAFVILAGVIVVVTAVEQLTTILTGSVLAGVVAWLIALGICLATIKRGQEARVRESGHADPSSSHAGEGEKDVAGAAQAPASAPEPDAIKPAAAPEPDSIKPAATGESEATSSPQPASALGPAPSQQSAPSQQPAPSRQPAPADQTEGAQPQRAQSQLDYEAVSNRLVESADPIAELKLFVGDIRTRMAATDGESEADSWTQAPELAKADAVANAASGVIPASVAHADAADAGDADGTASASPAADATESSQTLSPSPAERFAARMLVEAGLFSKDAKLPRLNVIRSRHSGMLYLRVEDQELSYLARLRVLKIEAALNAMRYVCSYFDDPASVSEEDCYKLMQSLATSICAQSPAIDAPLRLDEGEVPDGEWVVRRAIASAVESMQLPYRLEQRFRVYLDAGNVVFQVSLTPEQVFPSSMFVAGVGIVQSSREMRRKVASAYAQRLAILLAASAFRTSRRVEHVWVVGTLDTAQAHRCYLCVDFDRWRFSKVDLDHVDDLPRIMRSFVPNMRVENDILRPVEQTASLDEQRFDPAWRHMPVGMVPARIPDGPARALGTQVTSGLAIEEADKRSALATDIMMGLAPADSADATEKNVKMVIDVAGDDPDPTVRSSAERLVRGLIAGTVDLDPYAVGEEFVKGDPLDRAAERAKECLTRHDAAGAAAVLEPVLAPLDRAGVYADEGGVTWRYFGNYVDRVLYNRAHAKDGKALLLLPDAYFAAHFYLSAAYLALDRKDEALAHARRLVEVAPLDKHANLQLVRCLEEAGKGDEALEALKSFMRDAHDPEAIGLGYYRMASFQWEKGNILAAQACYQNAMSFIPQITPVVVMEVSGLAARGGAAQGAMQPPVSPMSKDEVRQTLGYYDIPVAPSDAVEKALFEGARASVDAQAFPVAQNFVGVLASFDPDDVTMDVMESLGGAPDQ